jgi:polyisoprenyl-teichoic acid--peptidoglycan teichoic acid transferase
VRRGIRRAGIAVRIALLATAVYVFAAGSGLEATTMSLTRVETAKDVDFREGVVWILVLGSDSPPGAPVDSGDTDAIQLLGINFDTGSAAAIGVPRDSVVELPGVGVRRINIALREGGPTLAAHAIEELVGIAPDLVLVTASEGFLDMVAAAGGVTVDSDAEFDTDEGDVHVVTGPNRFDADSALDYARTRYNLEGDDFERSANHQALLLGILHQLRAHEDDEGFLETVGLAALGGLETDLSPPDLYRLTQAVTQVDPALASGCVVPGTPFVGEGGAQLVQPDIRAAHRFGDDVAEDARFDRPCVG